MKYFIIIPIIMISLVFCIDKNEIIYSSSDVSSDTYILDEVSTDISTGPVSNCNATERDVICVGAIAVKLTPEKYEIVKSELFNDREYCPELDGPGRCGYINNNKWKELSSKWKTDFFYDCGTDRICPGDPEYKGPDADGSENNGIFDGYWVAGYNSSTPMQGVHDDIWARIIVLRKNDITAALIYIDYIGFFKSDIDRIRSIIKKKAPAIGFDSINISSTHTHASIDTMGMWGPDNPFSGITEQSGANDNYIKEISNKIVDGTIQAAVSMQEARIKTITRRVGIDQIANDVRDPFIIDDNMSVVAFENLKGERIATLINWGAHPETLGGITNYVSSDYVHYLREAIEKGISGTPEDIPPSGGIAVFMQGAQGGMITTLDMDMYDDYGNKIEHRESYKNIQQVGYNIARKAYDLLNNAEYLYDISLNYKQIVYRTPLENKWFWIMFDLGLFRDRPKWKIDPSKENWIDNIEIETEVSRLDIGDITILFIPGELFPELAVGGYKEPYEYSFGHKIISEENQYPPDIKSAPEGPYIRDIMKGRVKMLSILGNDSLGYLVPEYDFKLNEANPYMDSAPGDHYEETRSIGIENVRIMLEKIKELYKD